MDRSMAHYGRLLGGFAVALLVASPAAGQDAASVAVVINESHPDSIRVGEQYIAKRSIPPAQVIRLQLPAGETISRADYAAAIEAPISRALAKARLQDQIIYLVLTTGMPFRIDGTAGQQGTSASVDSELTLLYRRMTGRAVPLNGPLDNPYFGGASGESTRFDRKALDIFLVTRLDGPTPDDAIGLIGRSAATASGSILLDGRGDASAALADRWLTETAETLAAGKQDAAVIHDKTSSPGAADGSLIGYYSWGASDPALRKAPPTLTFAPTGIAATIGSTDAQALKPAADARLPFTSLLIRGGAAGVGANVSEPYLRSALRPGILFPAYISGLPLAEAFYRAMPHLSWQSVIFGDPLVRLSGSDPVASPTLAFDETTGLPAHFARRRLDVLKAELRGVPEPAIVQVLAAEDRQLRDDHQGAAEALSKAVDLAPEAVSIRLRLAMLHDEQGETARAIDGYRKVLARAPRHAVALNNLAYRLAADKETIDEALELARRAHAIAPEDANVLDTVGWVHHLAGHTAEAAPLLREAVRRAPQRVAVRIHAATVLVELGQHAEAQVHLDVASKLDPSTNRREDVQQLRARIAR
jgi:uncharacterized protein (TIGR03790 family)